MAPSSASWFCLAALEALLISLLLALLVIEPPSHLQAWQNTLRLPRLPPWRPSSLHCTLVFVKISKCASSTVGGIARRIASNHNSTFGFAAIRGMAGQEFYSHADFVSRQCVLFANHFPRPADIPWLRSAEVRRNVTLFSFIRQPGPRFLSARFFWAAQHNRQPSEKGILADIDRGFKGDFLMSWLGGHIGECAKEMAAKSCALAILAGYDFIGLVERMHESLVLLKILLGLSFSDVLHVFRSKASGGYGPRGHLIQPALHTPAIEAKLEQKARGSADELLYGMVNASLDSTIAFLGKERVARELATLEQVLEAAGSYCKGRVDGTSQGQDCYWKDNGCGVKCMDEFVSTAMYRRLVRA